jgi:dihydrofolate synthase/folylpolyglutamate synthase
MSQLSNVWFIQEQEEPVTILFQPFGMRLKMLGLLERLPHVPLILLALLDGALSEKNQQDRDFVADYQQFIEKWQSDGQGILIITVPFTLYRKFVGSL